MAVLGHILLVCLYILGVWNVRYGTHVIVLLIQSSIFNKVSIKLLGTYGLAEFKYKLDGRGSPYSYLE